MRTTSNLLIAMMLSGSVLAQQAANPQTAPNDTNSPTAAVTNVTAPPADLGATNAPAKKAPAKKKSTRKPGTKPKKAVSELRTIPLVPGPAIVDANHVNVRGQAKLNSEVVGRLAKGQKVTVITEITRKNSAPDEPSAWAKIALPSDVHVWVNSGFVDPANKTVKSRKLNLRGGPGENFSVLGRLQRGDSVSQVTLKGDWMEIEAPTNAYAFVAAQYLKQEAAPPEQTTPAEPVATPAAVTNEAPIATAPTGAPTNLAATEASAGSATNAAADDSSAASDEPQPRIVQREGIVNGMTSIQAPSHFKLVSPDNGRTIDYLYTTSPYLDLSRYKGLRIIVTGEEGLEERWGNTPVITIQKIQVIE